MVTLDITDPQAARYGFPHAGETRGAVYTTKRTFENAQAKDGVVACGKCPSGWIVYTLRCAK